MYENKMKYILDTNFIFSLFSRTDSSNAEAISIYESIPENGEIIIPAIVVAELLASGDPKNFKDICMKISNEIAYFTDEDLSFIQESIAPEKRRALKSNDCIIFAITKRNKAKLITFDKRFEAFIANF